MAFRADNRNAENLTTTSAGFPPVSAINNPTRRGNKRIEFLTQTIEFIILLPIPQAAGMRSLSDARQPAQTGRHK